MLSTERHGKERHSGQAGQDISVGEFLSLFLRRNPNRKNGAHGSLYLVIRVAKARHLCGERRAFGLRTSDCRKACARALRIVRLLKEEAGFVICNKQLAALASTSLPLWTRVDGLKVPPHFKQRGFVHAAASVANNERT